MSVKATGAEFKAYYGDRSADVWPEGAWHDDETVLIDGATRDPDSDYLDIHDAAVVTLSGGVVFMTQDADDGPSMEAHFKRWRKKQSTEFLTVEAPKDTADAVRAAIVAAGGKVT